MTYRNRRTGTLINVLARATHAQTSVCLVVYRDAQQTDAPTYADSPEGFEARFEPVPVEVQIGGPVHLCPEGDSGIFPCCGLTPFEARNDRWTTAPEMVTCRGGAR